jgi:beta-N-acetylhexosaminidase
MKRRPYNRSVASFTAHDTVGICTGPVLWQAVVVVTLLVILPIELRSWSPQEAALPRDLAVDHLLGQHFVLGYDHLGAVRALVAKGLVGGIFVNRRNADTKSTEDLRREIQSLQALSRSAGFREVIVATDQEGGFASLSPPLAKLPPLASLVLESRTNDELEAKAEAYGMEQGGELARLGITVNFSPVVDLPLDDRNEPRGPYSLISRRAISSDPRRTVSAAQGYAHGLERAGVIPTLKHFPGLGRVKPDTHRSLAVLHAPISTLSAWDWEPFREVAQRTNALIMLSHVILAEIDEENPVSFSRAVVQNVIRNDWRYDRVLITDDLTMAAAYNQGLCKATVKALNAGVDLLLISSKPAKYYEALRCALHAYREGRLNLDELEHSRLRLERLVQALDESSARRKAMTAP